MYHQVSGTTNGERKESSNMGILKDRIKGIKKKNVVVLAIGITAILLCLAGICLKNSEADKCAKNPQINENAELQLEETDTALQDDQYQASTMIKQYTFLPESEMPELFSVEGGVFSIEQDETADDQFVLKCVTGFSKVDSGVKMIFDSINIASLDHIFMRIKTTEYVDIRVNDISTLYGYKNYPEYTEVDLLPYLLEQEQTSLTSIEVGRVTKKGVEVYFDAISFIDVDYSKVKYTFQDAYDLNAVYPVDEKAGGNFVRVKDTEAEDCHALKITTEYLERLDGAMVTFDDIDISQYEHIYLRIKTKGMAEIYLNGTNIRCSWKEFPEYSNIDIIPFLKDNGEETLTSIVVGKRLNSGIEIYIDGITFVTSE